MKKVISFLIMTAILVSTFSSCSNTSYPNTVMSDKITVSTSSASEYGTWLTERLGTIPDELILGIGSSANYDIDMSSFEDDGYLIKVNKGGTVIFGKTEEGLDLACRRYANDIDLSGNAIDTVYHDGYRIDDFKLFGKNISDFTVEYPVDSNDNTLFAISELVRLIEMACGTVLAQNLDISDNGSVIRFVPSDDSILNGGYRYYEDNGNLIFEYNGNASDAVYAFLENECGWHNLTHGSPFLAENKLVDIKRGIDVTETPAFRYFAGSISYDNDTPASSASQVYEQHTVSHAANGMAVYDFANMGAAAEIKQICYTDETVFNIVLKNVKKYIILSKLVDFNCSSPIEIDISQAYDADYCNCENCLTVSTEEGSLSGAVVRFANKLSESLREHYPDTVIKILADKYTSVPPVTAPLENVYVTFEYIGGCTTHTLSGIECETSNGNNAGNILLSDRLMGWLLLTDKVYVSYISDDALFGIDTVYENILYLHSCGVMGVHLKTEYPDSPLSHIEDQLFYLICRNINIGREKFDEYLCTLLHMEYGDGWFYIKELIDNISKIKIMGNCGDQISAIKYDTVKYSDMLSGIIGNIETSILISCSEKQMENCELLSCRLLYEGCFSSYFDAYYSEDTAMIDTLENCYSMMLQRLEKYGITEKSNDLYTEAWTEWEQFKDLICNIETPSYENQNNDSLAEYCEAVSSHTADDRLTLAFATDTHYSSESRSSYNKQLKNNIKSMMRITRYTDIDLFVHGGDLIDGNQSSRLLALDSLIEATDMFKGIHANIPMVFLRGNHDDNSWYSYMNNDNIRYDIFDKDVTLTSSDWRNYFTNNSREIITDETGCYGYFDHEGSKIRVLLLDTSDMPYEDNGNGYYKYGAFTGHGIRQEQLEFMANAMLFTDKGEEASEWAILVVSHVPIETIKNNNYRFGGLDATGRNNYAFLRMLEAYKCGEVFDEKQLSATNYGDGGYLTANLSWNDSKGDFAYDLYADFSANGPGEVIGFITGHLHIDNFSDEVGKVSYSGSVTYPDLSCGYPYFTVGAHTVTTFTVERNGDGTGCIFADHLGVSVVPYESMINEGDDAILSSDPVCKGMITSDPDTGSVASGHYSVYYSQNR